MLADVTYSRFMLFSSSMLWLQRRLAVLILALNCLVHCAVPNTARRNEKLPTTPSHSDSRTDHEIKLPKTAGSKPTTRPTTKKSTTKKTEAPELVNEFSLNEILFKGRQSSKITVLCSFSYAVYIHPLSGSVHI